MTANRAQLVRIVLVGLLLGCRVGPGEEKDKEGGEDTSDGGGEDSDPGSETDSDTDTDTDTDTDADTDTDSDTDADTDTDTDTDTDSGIDTGTYTGLEVTSFEGTYIREEWSSGNAVDYFLTARVVYEATFVGPRFDCADCDFAFDVIWTAVEMEGDRAATLYLPELWWGLGFDEDADNVRGWEMIREYYGAPSWGPFSDGTYADGELAWEQVTTHGWSDPYVLVNYAWGEGEVSLAEY